MGLRANVDGEDRNYEFVNYDSAAKEFVFGCTKDDSSCLNVSCALSLDDEFKDRSFSVFPLAKKDVRENDIFQVYDRKNDCRIGWCIPAVALDSLDHDYFDNPHFLRYAYMCLATVLSQKLADIDIQSISIASSDNLRVSDIFHDQMVFLVISNETLLEMDTVCLARIIPSLAKYGYVDIQAENPGILKFSRMAPSGSRMYLEFVSEDIIECELISPLIRTVFVYDGGPILRFFFLYQIIELLLEYVFKNEQGKIANELINVQGDLDKTKDVLEEINRISSEKRRMYLLMADYIDISNSNLLGLERSCNQLLSALDKGESNNFHEYLYPIRNYMFHRYRDFPTSQEELLGDVVDAFMDVLPSLLSAFTVTSR